MQKYDTTMRYLYISISRKPNKMNNYLKTYYLIRIALNEVNAIQQTGTNDCGLFALAFFFALFNIKDLYAKQYKEKTNASTL